jgi:hypothetical protein
VTDRHERGFISEEELDQVLHAGDKEDAPPKVKACTRFPDDVNILRQFFELSDPPVVTLRSKSIISVVYGFGDASGTGLGATFTNNDGFSYRVGVWGADDLKESSNWKEFTNIVESLEEEAATGGLDNSEIFMFTDNATVESCAERGTSSSPKLLALVVRLRLLSTRVGIKLHLIHVAGTRMIAQGTDGVSRGFLAAGIMNGQTMGSFIPIHLTASQRSPDILSWIKEWADPDTIELDPMGWFEAGHDITNWSPSPDGFERPILTLGRTYLWVPPPFACDVALAELRKARIKRQESSHIIVVPRLCTALWQRQLFKACDLVFPIPAGAISHWPSEMHEPLLIGIVFPFIRCRPWQLRGTPKMFALGRELHSLFGNQEVDPRPFLRELWSRCLRLRSLPQRLVWKMLYFQ